MKTLPEIEAEINRLAAIIGASESMLPTYGRSQDGARPHIEVSYLAYHYVVVERGEEFLRETTGDLDELLYYVFESVTFSLACDFECRHRIAGQDSRRQLFDQQVLLLSLLSPSWAEREAGRHRQILQRHPFNDRGRDF